MAFKGLSGFEEWAKDINGDEDYLFVKIYNGKFTHRGAGNPMTKFRAEDIDDLIDKTKSHLDGAVGKFTISLNKVNSGGDPYKRFVEMGTSGSVSGTPSNDMFQSIGGITGYIDAKLKIQALEHKLERAEETIDDLEYKIENPENQNVTVGIIKDIQNDPEGYGSFVEKTIGAFAQLIDTVRNPSTAPAVGGTEISQMDVDDNGNYQMTEDEMTQFLQLMVDIRQKHFPNKTFVSLANDLKAKLDANPLLAKML